MPNLILLTHSFPYGHVESFVETEILYLARHFEQVIVVPSRVYGTPRPVPENVKVEKSLGQRWPKGLARGVDSARACIKSGMFYGELVAQPKVLTHWNPLARLVAFIGDYERLRRWVADYLTGLSGSGHNVIIYTYWAGPLTVAAGSLKSQFPQLTVVSRAHRIDLYEEIHARNYMPLRTEMLAVTDRVFSVSEHGREYLSRRYPDAHIEVSRLGVNDPGFSIRFSDDGVFRIVSCSYMVGKKRLDLLLEAVTTLAQRNPSLSVEWHHLGGGELQDQLDSMARNMLPENARHVFHGQIPNRSVMEFYQNQPLDVFVNTSASEGVPVSIMEAQSCGLPIIATAVGGTPEIVTDENGFLLESNPSTNDVAELLEKLAMSPDLKYQKGNSSKRNWQMMYNAEANYSAFAERLWTLSET